MCVTPVVTVNMCVYVTVETVNMCVYVIFVLTPVNHVMDCVAKNTKVANKSDIPCPCPAYRKRAHPTLASETLKM